MPRKTLVIHAGPHKTGTTSLQFGLTQLRDPLARHGWAYPALGIVQFGHHDLARRLERDPDNLAPLLAAHDRIVLSSESFVYLGGDSLRALRRRLPADWQVQVILFLRTPVDLWPSHWQELVKHGQDHSFLEYLAAFAGWTTALDAATLNPVLIAARFAAAFGRESLRLFSYDNMIAAGQEILELFLHSVLGVTQPLQPGDRPRFNAALPDAVVELLRSLNERCLQRTGTPPGERIVNAYMARRPQIEAQPAFAAFAASLAAHGGLAVLDSTHDLLRHRDRQLMARFGDRVENKATADQLSVRGRIRRDIRYGPRYWTDRHGHAPFIDDILASFDRDAGSLNPPIPS